MNMAKDSMDRDSDDQFLQFCSKQNRPSIQTAGILTCMHHTCHSNLSSSIHTPKDFYSLDATKSMSVDDHIVR